MAPATEAGKSERAGSASQQPQEIHKPSFLLFIILAPAGLVLIFAIIVIMQVKQFMAMVAPQPIVWSIPENPEYLREISSHRMREWITDLGSDSLILSKEEMQSWVAFIPSHEEKNYGLELGDSTLHLLSTQPVTSLKGGLDFIFHRLGRGGYLNANIEGYLGKEGDAFGFIPIRATLDEVKVPIIALTKRGDMGIEDFWPQAAPWEKILTERFDTAYVADGQLIAIRKPK